MRMENILAIWGKQAWLPFSFSETGKRTAFVFISAIAGIDGGGLKDGTEYTMPDHFPEEEKKRKN